MAQRMKAKERRAAANRRVGRRAIVRYTRQLVMRVDGYLAKPTKRAERRYLDAVQSLGALALLFEEAAARNYRVIRLGLKAKSPGLGLKEKKFAISAQRVR